MGCAKVICGRQGAVLDKFLSKLKGNDLYTMLVNIQYYSADDGQFKGTTPMDSMIVTGNANPELIAVRILNGIKKAIASYNMKLDGGIVSVHWREWISQSDYKKLVTPEERTAIVNKVLDEEAKLKNDTQTKIEQVMHYMNMSKIMNYLDEFPTFDSITHLPEYKFSKLDNDLMESLKGLEKAHNIKIKVYQDNVISNKDKDTITNLNSRHKLYFVFEVKPNKERIICVGESGLGNEECGLSYKDSLEYWNSNRYPYPKWTIKVEREGRERVFIVYLLACCCYDIVISYKNLTYLYLFIYLFIYFNYEKYSCYKFNSCDGLFVSIFCFIWVF